MWDVALRKEWDGLCEREVFEHDLTKQQLYDRGIPLHPNTTYGQYYVDKTNPYYRTMFS